MQWKASHSHPMRAEKRNQTYNISFERLPRFDQKVPGSGHGMRRFRVVLPKWNVGNTVLFAIEPVTATSSMN